MLQRSSRLQSCSRPGHLFLSWADEVAFVLLAGCLLDKNRGTRLHCTTYLWLSLGCFSTPPNSARARAILMLS